MKKYRLFVFFWCCLVSFGATAQTVTYTPQPGSPVRSAIMDAARLATNTTQSFKVDALVVLDNGIDASAVAAIEVAKQDVEIGGIFLFVEFKADGRQLL